MRDLFQSDESDGLFLVTTSNTFNSLSQPAALWNSSVLWPCCSRFFFNSYRGYAVILLKACHLGSCLFCIVRRELYPRLPVGYADIHCQSPSLDISSEEPRAPQAELVRRPLLMCCFSFAHQRMVHAAPGTWSILWLFHRTF